MKGTGNQSYLYLSGTCWFILPDSNISIAWFYMKQRKLLFMSLRDFLFGYLLFGYFKMIEEKRAKAHATQLCPVNGVLSRWWVSLSWQRNSSRYGEVEADMLDVLSSSWVLGKPDSVDQWPNHRNLCLNCHQWSYRTASHLAESLFFMHSGARSETGEESSLCSRW